MGKSEILKIEDGRVRK